MVRLSHRKELGPKKRNSAQVDSRRPIMDHLKGILESLNPTERMIADCILADPEKVLTSAVADLRSDGGASAGSIVAFCRRLGTSGFVDNC